jgi:signal transduction histidine kinase
VPRKSAATDRSRDELWHHCLQRLAGHIAHDLKGALNGVSVNLEVVKGRAERTESAPAEIHRFAVSAATQLEVVIKVTSALLSLARSGRAQPEVSSVARQLVALLEDTFRSDGVRLELIVDGGMAAPTGAPLGAVRLVIGETLLALAGQKVDVQVRVRSLPAPVVEIRPAPAGGASGEITRAMVGTGITVVTDGHGISIGFPGPAANPTEEA